MKRYKLDKFLGGWFIGDFEPSLHKSKDFEVCVKNYKKGEYDLLHTHKIAVEITVMIQGKAKMCGEYIEQGDIIYLSPGDESSFEAIEDCSLAAVKFPSIPNDKYILDQPDD